LTKLLIADAAVEFVPKTWLTDKTIRDYYRKTGRMPLKNASTHQHFLQDFPVHKRFDRPDILHFGLLTALGYEKHIDPYEVYFSCPYGYYKVNTTTRIPRSQLRFYGLLESIFLGKDKNELIQKINPDDLGISPSNTIIFSSKGKMLPKNIPASVDTYIFGGFAHGSYITKWETGIPLYSLSPHPLELWTAISRFLNMHNSY
jgi:rRNA pseudouridine-1189 N-methylase Emg1 (Nep1/Mra1 family)